MAHVYLGIGSNLGDREEHIREALKRLNEAGARVIKQSQLYETEPWGITDQPRFINAACLVETDLPPHALLRALKRIEREMGRVKGARYGPRIIDLDILLYDRVEMVTKALAIPHPGMLERETVLVPLAEIAPTVRHPVTGRTMAENLAMLGEITGIAVYPPGL